jgi:chemotaxis protein CheX
MNFDKATTIAGTGRECWPATLQLAVEEVFDLMLGSTLEVPPEPAPAGDGLDVTAMVGMAGQLCGLLSVCCSAKSAARIASRMLGVDAHKCGPQAWDALGEISNMVAGNFKNKIASLREGCMLSVPTVICGEDYRLRSLGNEQIRVGLLFEGKPLVVTLEIHN